MRRAIVNSNNANDATVGSQSPNINGPILGTDTISVTGSTTNIINIGDDVIKVTGWAIDTDGFISDTPITVIESYAEITLPITSTDAGTVSSGPVDCYLSSDGTQPGSHTGACLKTGNWSTFQSNIASTVNYSLTFYYGKNITTLFASGTQNHQYVGKVQNLTYINGTIVATGWENADYNDSVSTEIPLVNNVVNVPGTHNYTIEHALEFYYLTSIGPFNNTLYFIVNI